MCVCGRIVMLRSLTWRGWTWWSKSVSKIDRPVPNVCLCVCGRIVMLRSLTWRGWTWWSKSVSKIDRPVPNMCVCVWQNSDATFTDMERLDMVE